jgi:hypothetical protein|tara:strand:- start:6143 stop:6562 length:420 start_codon:yes stop_codon:yes gene_type:complete
MGLYKQFILLTLEGLVGVNITTSKQSLDQILLLSQMKTFHNFRNMSNNKNLANIKQEIQYEDYYNLLVMQILYVLNFKKKFCQKNFNRLISNYFKITYESVRKKTNILTIPEYVINDNQYLNTLALNNLYAISEFNNNE